MAQYGGYTKNTKRVLMLYAMGIVSQRVKDEGGAFGQPNVKRWIQGA